MIWPSLWLCVLAVVVRKHRTAMWCNKLTTTHDPLDAHRRRPFGPYHCQCAECSDFVDPFLQWARIR